MMEDTCKALDALADEIFILGQVAARSGMSKGEADFFNSSVMRFRAAMGLKPANTDGAGEQR